MRIRNFRRFWSAHLAAPGTLLAGLAVMLSIAKLFGSPMHVPMPEREVLADSVTVPKRELLAHPHAELPFLSQYEACVQGGLKEAIKNLLSRSRGQTASVLLHGVALGAVALLRNSPQTSPSSAPSASSPKTRKKMNEKEEPEESEAENAEIPAKFPPSDRNAPVYKAPPGVAARSEAELVAEAKAALDAWKQTGEEPAIPGAFLMQADNLDVPADEAKFALSTAYEGYRKLLAEERALSTATSAGTASDGGTALDSFERVRLGLSARLRRYCKGQARLTDLFSADCGNCEAETKLMIAMLSETSAKAPPGEVVGIQVFTDHIQPVLYNASEHRSMGLVAPGTELPVLAPIYRPTILYYNFLVKHGMPRSPELERKLTLDPGIEPASLEQSLGGSTNSSWSFDFLRNGRRFSNHAPPAFATLSLSPLGTNGKGDGLDAYGSSEESGGQPGSEWIFDREGPSAVGLASDTPFAQSIPPFGFLSQWNEVILDHRPTPEEMRRQHGYHAYRVEGKWHMRAAFVVARDPADVAKLRTLPSSPSQDAYIERKMTEKLEKEHASPRFRAAIRSLAHPEASLLLPPDSPTNPFQELASVASLYGWTSSSDFFRDAEEGELRSARLKKNGLFLEMNLSVENFSKRINKHPLQVIRWLDSLPATDRRRALVNLSLLRPALWESFQNEPAGKMGQEPLHPFFAALADPKQVGLLSIEDERNLAKKAANKPIPFLWVCKDMKNCLDKDEVYAPSPISDSRPRSPNGQNLENAFGKPQPKPDPSEATSQKPPPNPRIHIKTATMLEAVLTSPPEYPTTAQLKTGDGKPLASGEGTPLCAIALESRSSRIVSKGLRENPRIPETLSELGRVD